MEESRIKEIIERSETLEIKCNYCKEEAIKGFIYKDYKVYSCYEHETNANKIIYEIKRIVLINRKLNVKNWKI